MVVAAGAIADDDEDARPEDEAGDAVVGVQRRQLELNGVEGGD